MVFDELYELLKQARPRAYKVPQVACACEALGPCVHVFCWVSAACKSGSVLSVCFHLAALGVSAYVGFHIRDATGLLSGALGVGEGQVKLGAGNG